VPSPLHSTRALSKRNRPRESTTVRPASLATTFPYGQYAAAGGRVVVVVVVAAFAEDEADDCRFAALVDGLARPPPQPARSATSMSAAKEDPPTPLRTAKQV
jgi:hypothetical protein